VVATLEAATAEAATASFLVAPRAEPAARPAGVARATPAPATATAGGLRRDLDVHRPPLDRRRIHRVDDLLGHIVRHIDEAERLEDVDRADRAARDVRLVGDRADEVLRPHAEVVADVDEQSRHAGVAAAAAPARAAITAAV